MMPNIPALALWPSLAAQIVATKRPTAARRIGTMPGATAPTMKLGAPPGLARRPVVPRRVPAL
jgi:hypothetical protein